MHCSQLQQLEESLLWQQLFKELEIWQKEVVQVSWQAICAIWREMALLMFKSFKAACLEDSKEQVGQHSRAMQAIKNGAARNLQQLLQSHPAEAKRAYAEIKNLVLEAVALKARSDQEHPPPASIAAEPEEAPPAAEEEASPAPAAEEEAPPAPAAAEGAPTAGQAATLPAPTAAEAPPAAAWPLKCLPAAGPTESPPALTAKGLLLNLLSTDGWLGRPPDCLFFFLSQTVSTRCGHLDTRKPLVQKRGYQPTPFLFCNAGGPFKPPPLHH